MAECLFGLHDETIGRVVSSTSKADTLRERENDRCVSQDYYSALLKAYIVIKPSETIIEFIEAHTFFIPIECVHLLLQAQCPHAAAILYTTHEKHEQAITIWKK